MKEPLLMYIFSLYLSLRQGGFVVRGGHRPCLDGAGINVH
jgi:hypothetical protein